MQACVRVQAFSCECVRVGESVRKGVCESVRCVHAYVVHVPHVVCWACVCYVLRVRVCAERVYVRAERASFRGRSSSQLSIACSPSPQVVDGVHHAGCWCSAKGVSTRPNSAGRQRAQARISWVDLAYTPRKPPELSVGTRPTLHLCARARTDKHRTPTRAAADGIENMTKIYHYLGARARGWGSRFFSLSLTI